MWRFIRATLVLLLLGAITTVGVAWWCAMHVDPDSNRGGVGTPVFEYAHAFGDGLLSYEEWSVTRKRMRGVDEVQSVWTDLGGELAFRANPMGDPAAILPRWASEFAPRGEANIWTRHVHAAKAWGWPMPALWYVESGESTAPEPPHIGKPDRVIEMSPVMRRRPTHIVQQPRYLPLRVYWLGFLVDSLVYAPMWLPAYGLFLLFLAGFRRGRARWRLMRGRCPKCKYDLRGTEHAVCPECGTALAPTPPAASSP